MDGWFVFMFVYIPCVYLVPTEAIRGHKTPGN